MPTASTTSENEPTTQEHQTPTEEPSASTEPQPTESKPEEPFKFAHGDSTIPEWMWGKTPQEVAKLTNDLASAYSQHQPQPAATPQPQEQPPMNQNVVSPPDPNLIYDNPQEYQRQLDAYNDARFQAQMNQFAQPFMASQAELAKNASKSDPAYKTIWSRWEPEIESELAGIPPQQRTKALYDKAAAIVRGNHWQELAREEAERLGNSNVGTERGGAGNAPPEAPSGDALDEAWDSGHAYFENAKANGVTKDQLRNHAASMKVSIDDFVSNAKLGNVIQTKTGLQRTT